MRTLNRFAVILAFAILATGCVTTYPTVSNTPGPGYGHPPPRVRIARPAEMIFLYSFGVYYVPDIRYEIFFTDGLWYFRYQTAWYWSNTYSGPWTYIAVERIPRGLQRIPPGYRGRQVKTRRVPYGHWKKVPPGQAKKRPRPPAVLRITQPRTLIFLPAFGIYYIPDSRFDVFFYGGFWYRLHDDYWYRSREYRGPWDLFDDGDLPREFRRLPRDYRERDYRTERVPYGHWDRRRRDDDRRGDRRWDRDDDDDRYDDRGDRRRDRDDDRYDDRDDRRRDRDDDRYDDRGDRRRDRDDDRYDDRGRGSDDYDDRHADRGLPPGQRKKLREKTTPPPAVTPGDRDRDRDRRRTELPGPLAPYRIREPKLMYHLPRAGIYYIPEIPQDVFYYGGLWYTRDKGSWYAGETRNGPWEGLHGRDVPDALWNLPADYRARKDELDTKIVSYGHWNR